MSDYEIRPITLRTAVQFVQYFHRHSGKVRGYKFALGLFFGEELVGIGIAGRPVARGIDDGRTLEIQRVCVKDGHRNVNSRIYGRMKKIGQLMGYSRIVTYTLETESGASLFAIGASPFRASPPHSWDTPSRRRHEQPIYQQQKIRWELLA